MNRHCSDFVDALIDLEPTLRGVRDEASAYWAPEEPPLTTLFAELGAGLIDDPGTPDSDRESRLLALVERAMTGDDEMLRTAVATGLIEAMANGAERRPGQWRRVRAGMGPASAAHADAWIGG